MTSPTGCPRSSAPIAPFTALSRLPRAESRGRALFGLGNPFPPCCPGAGKAASHAHRTCAAAPLRRYLDYRFDRLEERLASLEDEEGGGAPKTGTPCLGRPEPDRSDGAQHGHDAAGLRSCRLAGGLGGAVRTPRVRSSLPPRLSDDREPPMGRGPGGATASEGVGIRLRASRSRTAWTAAQWSTGDRLRCRARPYTRRPRSPRSFRPGDRPRRL